MQTTAPSRGPAFAMSTPPAAVGTGLGMSNTGDVRLAAAHFAVAILFLIAGTVALVWISPLLATGLFLSPHVAGVTHLFTLGWLTTTIFGALYQLLPVALGTPIRWRRMGYASFAAFAPGVALFSAGVAMNHNVLHHVGIALVSTGVVLATVNFAVSLSKASGRDITWYAVATAIAALSSTLILGIVLLHNLHTGFLGGLRVRLLSTHLHIALVGWALVMMVGMAHRLLPMFLLAHGADTQWSMRALALLTAGTLALSAGLLAALDILTFTGAILLAIGVACFSRQARLFFRARMRRKLDVGMRFSATGLMFLAAAVPLGLLSLVDGNRQARVATAYVILGMLGGIVMFVIGHFYKIVPFLAWITHQRRRRGNEPIPAIIELYSARAAFAQWVLMTISIPMLVAGTLAGHAHCVRAGAIFFGAGVVLFVSQFVRIAWPLRGAVAKGPEA